MLSTPHLAAAEVRVAARAKLKPQRQITLDQHRRAMPYRLTWEPPCGVFRAYFGNVTIAQRRASLEEICGDRRFDELRYSITDFLAVDAFENDRAATAEAAALHIAPLTTNPRIVMAAVATRPDLIAAIQSFKALGYTAASYEIFATVEAARQWIASATASTYAGGVVRAGAGRSSR